ncbi:two component transcriptional regulator, LytTR family [Flavobacteriaceae bacterium MAR_2010_188]|nr:two component transcriptional regulator, LytTR family [Flavobacteriaceae bacterium MAR_2010_188]
MINAILIDDELNALKNLKWEIEHFCPNIKIIDSFVDPVEAISAINYLKPDCVFLDIEMPEMDGFQLLNKLSYRNFDLIITTAYDNYAIKAFRAHAIDYLLKPIDSDDLKSAVSKITANKQKNVLGFELKKVLQSISPPTAHRKIGLPMAGRIVYKNPETIVYCKSDGNYSEVYFADGNVEVVTLKLKEVEELIEHSDFFRVHNSYLINIRHISEYVRTDGPYLIMSNKKDIPISRTKKNDLLQRLER